MGNEDGTCNKDYHQSREIDNASGSGSGNEANEIASTDSEHERESILHSRIDLKARVHEDTIPAVKKLKASHKASPSSDSSSELVIEVDIRLISKSKTKASSSITCHNEVPIHPKVDETECSTDATSLASDLTHESPPNVRTSTNFPPIQLMERASGFDANRIPSSVFSPKKGDWSSASNDSLFSIHIGNNSFSNRKFSVDFHHKSVGSDEFSKHGGGGEYKSSVGKPPLAVKGNGSDRNNAKLGKKFGELAAVVDRRVIDDHLQIMNYERVPWVVFKEDDVDTSCGEEQESSGDGSCCGCCTCASCCCCCTWLSCSCCNFWSCKWLSCCCLKWPSCSWRKCCSCCRPSCSWRKCCSCCRPSRLFSSC